MIIPILAILLPVFLLGGVILFVLAVGHVFRRAPVEAEDSADMMSALERMERRIATLERILDAESPEWRHRQ